MTAMPRIPPHDLAAIILCGGRSRRFGTDKAMATSGGVTLLENAVQCARVRADQIILACGPTPRYAEFGLPLAMDQPDVDGPLAGIVAGLDNVERPHVFLIAVDLADLTPQALAVLIDIYTTNPPVEFVLPRTDRGLEPLLSLGAREPLARAARYLVGTEDPAPRRLPDHLTTRFIAVSDDPRDPLRRALANINTRADLESPGR